MSKKTAYQIPLSATLLCDEDELLGWCEKHGLATVGDLAKVSDEELKSHKHFREPWFTAVDAMLSVYTIRRPGTQGKRDTVPARIWLRAKEAARSKAAVQNLQELRKMRATYEPLSGRVVSVEVERQEGLVKTYSVRLETAMDRWQLEEKLESSLRGR